jgi:hypothetical protein
MANHSFLCHIKKFTYQKSYEINYIQLVVAGVKKSLSEKETKYSSFHDKLTLFK